ncbi:MAG: Ppx/GppA family phosphatase [Alphaproteobacteria bacterium]|nr:Ppx/GppA family phosphatase [Alphaproteobacteria bacterium]
MAVAAGISKPSARRHGEGEEQPIYAALDLGTNNCRLLVARPTRRGFSVIDAFSRIVRLGEGLGGAGSFSDAAIDRTLAALRVCAGKVRRHRVRHLRAVATEACRRAANGPMFLRRVTAETGLEIEVITPQEEARLALVGCAPLLDFAGAGQALVFDIGGGSTELIWIRLGADGRAATEAWTSLSCGVVTLAERFGGDRISDAQYAAMVAHVDALLGPFAESSGLAAAADGGQVQMLGSSGTVTTLAGVHLGLPRYDRERVDGTWLTFAEIDAVIGWLRGASYEERALHPCIGRARADLVVAGCAILDAIRQALPAGRLRVADRGIREGLLFGMMAATGVGTTPIVV